MKHAIKTKLVLGVGTQFLLIVASVVVSMVALNLLTDDTRNILRDNYDTLEHCRKMSLALDDHAHPEAAVAMFQDNLEKQRNNITEVGEQALTDQLQQDFQAFAANTSDQMVQTRIRNSLNAITAMNLEAIQRKSAIAMETARTIHIVMGTVGTLSFIIAFVLLLNLPSSIADPIREFTASIKEIANRNYTWRIDTHRKDEFKEMADSFNGMAAKLQEYDSSNLSKMLFEKKRIEALINQMHNPIIGLNEEGKILFANHAALKILNMPSHELVGKAAQEVAHHNDLLRTLTQELLAKTTTKPHPLTIYADDRESFFHMEVVKITVAPVGETKQQYIGDVIILQNITQFKELDAAKTNFIATVSHEFKTPISSIKMSLQLLGNDQIGPLNEEQKALLHSIRDDADRLLRITSELLDLTQVESGQIHLNIHPVEIREIIDYALGATRVQAEQKAIRFLLALPDHLPTVLADSEKTAWVLTNLISNAIRYSYENATIFIGAKVEEGRLHLYVRDTGQGIAPQYQNKIFERYFRVPGTTKEGTGLGLAISKEFIEAQGGRIGMESDFGAGSTFWIELAVS